MRHGYGDYHKNDVRVGRPAFIGLVFMFAGTLVVGGTLGARIALASPSPDASGAPTPGATPSVAATATPSPAPPNGLRYSGDAFVSFADHAQSGPGLTPPEGPAFAAGSPLSPMTPYDVFSSAPDSPGIAGVGQFDLRADYSSPALKASATIGAAYATGSIQNAAYWGANLLPALNPHLGSTALPYQIAFTTHAGQDDGSAARVSLLSGSLGTHDGVLNVRGGWFDLVQSDAFVFAPPPLTNVTPNIGLQPAESLGTGPPALEVWPAAPPGLPLDGADLVGHTGVATLEVSNASLPALPGTSARLTLGSLVLDHGEGTRWSADFLHVSTGGATLSTTTMFGAGAMTKPGPQGPLPMSQLGGQQQTVAGLRGAFHAGRRVDAVVEIGQAWYNAQDVLEPGTQKPGGFYHAGASDSFGRAKIGLDLYRFEARYASAILPYGAPENVWSVAWSWPGVWLKSNYQLANNTTIGSNRQGYRISYALDHGAIDIHAAYAQYWQIDPAVLSTVNQVGFVEGFFLPQDDGAGTSGVMHQYALWTAWHPRVGDLIIDYVNDTEHRDFLPGHPQDAVSYQAPQVVFTFAHAFGKRAIADAGFGNYAMRGSWAFGALTNVDYQQSTFFAGAQYAETQHAFVLVQYRLSNFTGLPSQPGGPSPDFSGGVFVLEQRYHI
ncbi:MAG: hypothetical protein JO219_02585 [Candidatus Eremiobacteraeota bacterium]|nr:hypothetical protein [Candidatus Eremiobacteraeota bacterium]